MQVVLMPYNVFVCFCSIADFSIGFLNWAMLALHLGASSPSAQESRFFSIHFSKNFGCTFLSRLWCVFRFLAEDGPLFNEITGLSAIFHDRQWVCFIQGSKLFFVFVYHCTLNNVNIDSTAKKACHTSLVCHAMSSLPLYRYRYVRITDRYWSWMWSNRTCNPLH